MLKNILKRFQKETAPALEKRQAGVQLATSWPSGTIAPAYGGIESLATTRRCISLYSQFLSILALETEDEKDHYFLKLIEQPHPVYDRIAFYEALCWELLLNGQFVCRLQFDRNTGRIYRIDPYRNRSALAYVRKGDYSDPVALAQGVYYKSNFSPEVWFPYETLHIKDSLQSRGDALNAYPRSYFYRNLFNSGTAVANANLGLSQTAGRGPVLLTGIPAGDADADAEVRKQVQQLLQSGFSSSGNQTLTLPDGYKVQRMLGEQSHDLIIFLSERNDLELAKIWDVPFEILQVGKIGAQSLKEVWRQWIRINLRAFAAKVADGFSRAINDGTKFCFRVGKLRFSDQREAANYFSAMIQDGVLSPKEVKEALEEKLP